MALVDYLIILVYFAVVLGLGFWYQKRASRNLESYFLGGKRIHWLPLAMSGSVSNFDITGTMWIVSILFVLGMRSMWHHWMWGFLMGAFYMSYMGKWMRRSGVMTAAEWMKTRFGDDGGGRLARTSYAIMAVVMQAGLIGYAFQGIGKFASVYVPLEKIVPARYEAAILATAVIGVTTLYVILGGLYSVVVTDVVQTVILTLASILIAFIAWVKLSPESLSRLPEGWASLKVPWRIPEFAGTDNAGFELFGALVILWIVKGLLLNIGGPGQMYEFQRFLAARSPKDAAKVGAAWSLFLVVRWAMTAGIVLLAMTGAMGVVISDSEKVMPHVLKEFLPVGVKGIVVAGLLAAFMSTFSSTVNSGASVVVRDIWQAWFRPKAGERELVRSSYVATLLLVIVGIAIGFGAKSIAQIWNWLMMALGAAVIVPNVLRWYWWRVNGWGYSAGMLGGIALSLVVLFRPDIPAYVSFPIITVASLVACVVVSLVTSPVGRETLDSFYRTVRPFGSWSPVRGKAPPSGEDAIERGSVPLTVLNVALGMAAIACAYLAPMYLVGHWYLYASICAGVTLSAIVTLKFTWYDRLTD